VDIPEVFGECVRESRFLKENFTAFERLLLRMLDVDLESSMDFLTYILFAPSYLKKLLALGFEDGKKNHDKLIEFFEGD